MTSNEFECVPCRDTHNCPDRAAVAVVMDLPMCSVCASEARMTPTLLAQVEPEAPAKVERKRLTVPKMPLGVSPEQRR